MTERLSKKKISNTKIAEKKNPQILRIKLYTFK